MREENEMEFSGVYHKTSEQMSYALDEDRLIVNIKTGYDVKQIFIHYGDPYEAGILGGTTPEYIRLVKEMLDARK